MADQVPANQIQVRQETLSQKTKAKLFEYLSFLIDWPLHIINIGMKLTPTKMSWTDFWYKMALPALTVQKYGSGLLWLSAFKAANDGLAALLGKAMVLKNKNRNDNYLDTLNHLRNKQITNFPELVEAIPGGRNTLYSLVDNLIDDIKNSLVIPLVGHQLIRLAADAVTYPLLVVSTRMVAQNAFGNDKTYTGPIQGLKMIWNNEGIQGLYRGFEPRALSVLIQAGFSAAAFGLFIAPLSIELRKAWNYFKSKVEEFSDIAESHRGPDEPVREPNIPFAQAMNMMIRRISWRNTIVNLTLGAAAMLLGSELAYPFTVLSARRRLQGSGVIQEQYFAPYPDTTLAMFESTYRREGISGLYRGRLFKLLWTAAPFFMPIFNVFGGKLTTTHHWA
jgi:hypothetical protein